MPTEIHTICFHTRDAVERSDSRMVFELPMHRLSTPAVKISLGSVEFPMVQWTIEEDWNRLYLNEGIRLTSQTNELSVAVRDAQSRIDPKTPTILGVPMRLNTIVNVKRSGRSVEFECKESHHLWGTDGKACLVSLFAEWDGDVKVLSCGPRGGDLSLVTAWADKKLYRVSDTKFAVDEGLLDKDLATAAPSSKAPVFLYTSAVPSPHHLCRLLTLASRNAKFLHTNDDEGGEEMMVSVGQELSFAYDAQRDHVRVQTRFAVGTVVRILASPLASLLGVCTVAIRVQHEAEVLPCGPTNLWDFVRIPPGFYGPCHRSMCTGQPMRFGTEVEAAINRLYFPLPSGQDNRMQASPSTPHTIVFVDPWAKTHMCPIPCGRYTPKQLCLHLETEMTRTCNNSASFSVYYDEDAKRFVFSCEKTTRGGRVEPAKFSLLFNHPLTTEASRFGFPSQPCVGASTYTSTEPVHFPRTDLKSGSEPRYLSNLFRVSEIGSQKRFRFHATSAPTMTGVVCKKDGRGRCVVRTHVNGLPYAHGFQIGDVVRMFPMNTSATLLEPNAEKTEWKETEFPAAPPFHHDTLGVVWDESHSASSSSNDDDPSLLVLYMPHVADVGSCFHLQTSGPDPFNFCFSSSRPKTMDAYLLGFPEKSILWGVDGVLDTGDGCMIPPFDAPYLHCLDHPDYCLITFNESSSASLEHSYGGESKHVFCKLSLYPLFREERMLPRDAFLQRSTFSRFEIAFWNPNMKHPYHFHGAQFSFSLNFISVTPGGGGD